MSTKVVGWVVTVDDGTALGDDHGAITIYSQYDEAVRASGSNGHIRPAVQPRDSTAPRRGGRRKQQSEES